MLELVVVLLVLILVFGARNIVGLLVLIVWVIIAIPVVGMWISWIP